jgi:predicted nucleic acid-binding protein
LKRRLFADTSGIFAAYWSHDRRHAEASHYLRDRPELVTHRLIVIETVSLLTKRLSRFHAEAWSEVFHRCHAANVREFDLQVYREAEGFWRAHHHKEWDLIDCYSFVLMKMEGLKEVPTFDHHFRQAGFTAPLVP